MTSPRKPSQVSKGSARIGTATKPSDRQAPPSGVSNKAPAAKPSVRAPAAPAPVAKQPAPSSRVMPAAPASKPSQANLKPATSGSIRPSRIIRKEGAKPSAITSEPVEGIADFEGSEMIADLPEDAPRPSQNKILPPPGKGPAPMGTPSVAGKPKSAGSGIAKPAGSGIAKPLPAKKAPEPEVEEEEDEEEVEEPKARSGKSAAGSRRGAQSKTRSVRGSQKVPSGPLLSKKQMIIIGVIAILALAAVIAYKPVRTGMIVGDLETGGSRKGAAQTLLEFRGENAIPILADHMKAPFDASTHEGAAHGLALAMKNPKSELMFSSSLSAFKDNVPSAGAEDQAAFATALKDVADHYFEARGKKESGGKSPETYLNSVAPLLKDLAAAGKDPKARLIAIAGLGHCPVPGSCLMLLNIAKTEQGETRAKALDGLESSAALDAAGSLLETMAGGGSPEKGGKVDAELAAAAKRAFARVRDDADTGKLVDLLSNENEEVRKEVVKALLGRKKDKAALNGLVRALGDKSGEIKVMVIKILPDLNLGEAELQKLEPLTTDSSIEIRQALADALAQMRDTPSYDLLYRTFDKAGEGPTRDIFLTAFGKRGMQHNIQVGKKDFKSIELVMNILKANPSQAVRETLARLTVIGGQESREKDRASWGKQQWQDWYDNALKLRAQIERAEDIMNKCKQSSENTGNFKQLFDQLSGLDDELEKAKGMCQNDPEEAKRMDDILGDTQKVKMYFMKGSHRDDK